MTTSQHEATELERWWDAFDAQAQAHTAEGFAFYQLGLTAGQAANWANAGFSAAEADAWTAAGFAPSEADLASWYRDAGHEEPAEAYVASLADTTAGMVDEAERIEERAVTAQNEALMDDEYLEHGEVAEEEPYVETDAEAAYADSWGDIQAERAQEQGERLADEADEILAGVKAREAELDAIEADPDMVGSEAHAAYYWENGGEYPDGSHALDYTDADEMRAAGHPAAQADDYEPAGLREALDADEDGYPANGPEPDGRGTHVLDDDASTWAPEGDAAAAQYQADTLEYAVGDDLVVGGVAYNSDDWQSDGEGGVEPRVQVDEPAGAAPFHDDDADCDGF